MQAAPSHLLGSTMQGQSTVPGVRIDLSNIKNTTRFSDLQEDVQKKILMLDNAIQECMKEKDAIDAMMPGHGSNLDQLPLDVNFVSRKSEGAQNALSNDVTAVKELRDLVKIDSVNARLSFKAIDNLKLPTQYHQPGLWTTRGQQAAGSSASADADAETNSDLITFFSKTADEMEETMKVFERNFSEIEVHLHGVQGSVLNQMQHVAAQSKNGSGGGEEKLAELAAVLRDFEESIFQVAAKVGGAREGVTELQLKDFMGNGTNGMY
jgi:nucleoporin p58/p45